MNKMMKRIAALVCLLALSASAWASGGYIYDASGAVSLAVGKGEPRWAKINDTVSSGTVIRTGKASHAVLKFEDGQVVSLQADTTFQIRKYVYSPMNPGENSILFSMFKGGTRFVTGMIGKVNPDSFRLATPDTTLGIHGTDFIVVIASNGTRSQVVSGSISLTNAAGTTVLTAGQTALTSSATALTATVPASSVPAGTFGQLNAIALPAATPGPIPAAGAGALLSGIAPTTAASSTAAGTAATTTAGATAGTAATAAGGAAAGGAGIAAVTTAGAGISGTTIAIGIAAAAGVAAVVNATSTTSH